MATEAEQLEQQEEADLEAGFSKSAPPVTETKAPALDAEGKPIVATEEKPEVVVEEKPPEYVQITKEQFDNLNAAAAKTTEFGTKLDRALGTFGNVQEIVKKLQAGTASTATVRKFKDALKRTREDFPELADKIEADLEEAMGQPAAAAVVETTETKAPEKTVAQLIQEARDAEQLETLDEAHPQWRETVGKFEDKNPFRTWLATKDAAYQKRINNTRSALTIGGAIDLFNADTKKAAAQPPKKPPDQKIVARTDRIAGAVQPRGDGRPPPTKDTAEDDLQKGFYS